MTALASAPSFNFVVASGPLRPHLSGPLSQFVDPTRILAIVSQDGAKYLFKSEREFPPVDLRKASYLSVVTRRPAQSLGAFKPSEGQFKNCLTTVTGDVAIIRPDIFIQDAEGHTARFWSGVELLLGKLDEAFSRIEAEPEQPVTSVIVPIDDDLDAVFSDAGVIHVSGLKLRIIAPPRPVPAALESRILPAPSIHFGERSHVYIAAAAATASVAPPAPAVPQTTATR